MSVFLPTAEAGQARVGAQARVVLDAHPDTPLPARVSFVASEAQFTPKQVETESERRKLSFRVEVRIEGKRGVPVNPGTPGVAWIRLDEAAPWPEPLR
jgi:HlyD family secretion protein